VFADHHDCAILRQFESLSCAGYENINNIYRQTDRLFATETLCGDYSGRVLVLAQDLSTADRIRQRLKDEQDQNPFRHRDTNKTNTTLVEMLQHVGKLASRSRFPRAQKFELIDSKGTNASNCGVVYGSMIWLLKETASVSSAPPNLRLARESSSVVIKSAIESMPNLDRVICLGCIAYEGLAASYGLERSWRDDLLAPTHFTILARNRGVKCFPTSHLGPRGLAMRASFSKGVKTREACMKDFERALE
jgi:hypothetical protein